jgi:prophage regulatory protein
LISDRQQADNQSETSKLFSYEVNSSPKKVLKGLVMAMHQFLTLRQVLAITTLSKSTIYAAIKLGNFPAPVSISLRRVAWKDTDIQAWMARATSNVGA